MANTGLITGSSGLGSAFTSSADNTKTKKNDELGKDDFLKLLITQLKNQDPEQPTDSKEFVAQLAQFTQVERLISIDDNIAKQGNDVGSLAGYLGQEVTLDGSTVAVKGGNGGQISVDLTREASELSVQILNSGGEVVGKQALGAQSAGKKTVKLDGLSLPDGDYGVKITATNASGVGTFNPTSSLSGIVSGFVPGPDPKLIVDGREVSLSSIRQVNKPAVSAVPG